MKKLLFFSVLMGLISCKEKFLLYEKNELKGTLVLRDNFTETPDVVAPKATVFLSEKDNADPYLLKVMADDQGEFSLSYQPTEREPLKLVGEYTDGNGIQYGGNVPLNTFVTGAELPLTPEYKKGLLKVKVTNQPSNSEPVNGAKVYLFANKKQADAVVAAKDIEPTGALKTGTTNARGIAFFHNLDPAPANYYVVAKSRAGNEPLLSNVVEAPITVATVPSTIPTTQVLELVYPTPVTPAVTNDGTITVTVNTSPPLSPQGLKVYLFSTQPEAQSVKDPSGIVVGYKAVVIPTIGQAQFTMLDYGTYFLGLSGTLPTGTRVTAVSGEINVQSSQSVPYSFEIK